MNLLTIFTPTYNREKTVERLYKSLLAQTDYRFTWLIVDDGSTDNTAKLINQWIKESPFEIVYYYQENSGKSMAHNLGVEKTETELFTCVDSDDILTYDAVETILNLDCSDEKCVGMLLKKGLMDGTPITKWNPNLKFATLFEAYSKYGLSGDTMLIYKTVYMRRYSFPYFEGEKFVPESYLYDLIDHDGYLVAYDRVLYLCEYLDDGYSANMRRVNAENPNGYLAYIRNRIISCEDRYLDLFLYMIRYIAILKVTGEKVDIHEFGHPLISLASYIPGVLFYKYAYQKYV